jgi:hypothetical protein
MRQITEHTILAFPDAMAEIEKRGKIIEQMARALREISGQYANQDIGHAEYRIAAKQTADAALSEVE